MSITLFGAAAQSGSDPAAGRDTTTRSIALGLLSTFIATVGFLLLINYLNFGYNEVQYQDGAGKPLPDTVLAADIEMRKAWFDVLKSSLLLLGTALTTIIGYYFGQREGAVKAAEARREEMQTKEKAEAIVETVVKNADEAFRQGATAQGPSVAADDNPPAYMGNGVTGAAEIIVP